MSYAVHATFADTLTPSTAQKKQRVKVQGAKSKTTPLRYRQLCGLLYIPWVSHIQLFQRAYEEAPETLHTTLTAYCQSY